MCVPFAVAAGATAAAGALFGGYGALQQGRYESEIAKRNAAMEVERSRDSIDRGRDEARDFWRGTGALKGKQAAALAANGLDMSFGAPVAMERETAALAAEDAANLYRNVNERTKGHDITASNFAAEAKAARIRGRTAMVGSVFEAADSLMSGFQQHSAMRARLGIGKKPSMGAFGAAGRHVGKYG